MACAMPELIKSFAWDAFVLFYYAQVIGLDGFRLGLALAVILVFDAVADPYIGALSDRMDRAPLGRRHTLMAAAVAPFARSGQSNRPTIDRREWMPSLAKMFST